MRIDTHPGYTHIVKRLESGGFKVKWARGWSEIKDIEWSICDEEEAEDFVSSGGWIIVDQPEAKQEDALPDEFQFKYLGWVYDIKKISDDMYSTKTDSGYEVGPYPASEFIKQVEQGRWKILNKRPLTAEQQRANKEFREQKQALLNSVRLAESDIEHKQRMIANYKERVAQLDEKIVEEF